jgi:hypothetical protein
MNFPTQIDLFGGPTVTRDTTRLELVVAIGRFWFTTLSRPCGIAP